MIKSLKADAPDAAKIPQAAERRAWVRYPSRLNLLWQIFGMRKNEHLPARIQDVSLTGIGLVLSRSFPPATVLSITLQTATGESGPHLVRVKHVTRQADGSFLAGCTFLNELSKDELRGFIA
jgi:hypothetical protein